MGYSLSWLAVKGKSPQMVREELGFRTTGKREAFPEAALSAAELPGGWYVIVSNRSEQVVPDSAMERLASPGCELVTCFVEEHVMCSSATGWEKGRKFWSISHDSGRGIEHLASEGELPPAFNSIRAHLLSKQKEENLQKLRPLPGRKITQIGEIGCDYAFDIPVATAESLTGYRHDLDIPGPSGDPFEVLVSAAPARSGPASSQIRKRGLKMFAIGGGVFAAILFLVYWLSARGFGFHFALMAASLPFVFACIGFIGLVGGVPYQRLAQGWMSLRGWQRGVLGTFIVVAALAIIICLATFFVLMFT